MSGTDMFKMLGAQPTDRQVQECTKYGFFTDDYIECHIRHVTLTAYHPCGTCKMGKVSDPTTVVDPQLR